jgi:hypothetical protein
VIEVPGLNRQSEALLKQLDGLSQEDRLQLFETLAGTPEGKQALVEAEKIARALERRFGSSDPRALLKENLRLGPETYAKLDRIKHVARIAYQAQMAELSQQYELKRSLSKGLGLGM